MAGPTNVNMERGDQHKEEGGPTMVTILKVVMKAEEGAMELRTIVGLVDLVLIIPHPPK